MRATDKTVSSLLVLSSNGSLSISFGALILMGACLFASCTTGPVTTKSYPITSFFYLYDTVTRQAANYITGSPVCIYADDNYSVNFVAQSQSGIKTISLSGTSTGVSCASGSGVSGTFNTPTQTIDLAPLPGGQLWTQALDPYFFYWSTNEGVPAVQTAYKACHPNVLIGTVTYTGSATTAAPSPKSTSQTLTVWACPTSTSFISSSPDTKCVSCNGP